MPLIAYQSLNASSSTDHGLKSLQNKQFTKATNNFVVAQKHQALVLPINTGNINTPIEGPAELVEVAKLEKEQHETSEPFGAQIAYLFQNAQREFLAMPDILVVGELDIENTELSSMVSGQSMGVRSFASKKACQCFSSFSQGALSSQITFLKHGAGWVAYSVDAVIVVFVHVPNAIARSKNETELFYFQIAHSLANNGKIIDIVIGDTNQSSFNFTANALKIALGITYENAVTPNVEPVDNFQVSLGGTNSNATKMYDVAVINPKRVKCDGYAYLSQSSGAITVTDHCGLIINLKKLF